MLDRTRLEIVPAILRKTYERIEEDWKKVETAATHIQIDITDGVFAGDGTFRDIRRFKQLPQSDKVELHMMVHTPGHFVDDIIDLAPARCVFHIESFAGTNPLQMLYQRLREHTRMELGVAINPDSPLQWLEESLPWVDYVLFMGYNPGWSNQPLNPGVFAKMAAFRGTHPDVRLAVDGHVNLETVEPFVRAGATILCANSSIFGTGDPRENLEQLRLKAQIAAGQAALA